MGGWGYSAARAGEVTQLIRGFRSMMCAYVQRWYPCLTPIGVGGLYGGHLGGAVARDSWNSSASRFDQNRLSPITNFPSWYTISGAG